MAGKRIILIPLEPIPISLYIPLPVPQKSARRQALQQVSASMDSQAVLGMEVFIGHFRPPSSPNRRLRNHRQPQL